MVTRLPFQQKRITDINYFASDEFIKDTQSFINHLWNDSSSKGYRDPGNKGYKQLFGKGYKSFETALHAGEKELTKEQRALQKDLKYLSYVQNEEGEFYKKVLKVHDEAVKFKKALQSGSPNKVFYTGGTAYREAFTSLSNEFKTKRMDNVINRPGMGDLQKGAVTKYTLGLASRQANIRPTPQAVGAWDAYIAKEAHIDELKKALKKDPTNKALAKELAKEKAEFANFAYTGGYNEYEVTPTSMGNQFGGAMDKYTAFNLLNNPLGAPSGNADIAMRVIEQSQRKAAENQRLVDEYNNRPTPPPAGTGAYTGAKMGSIIPTDPWTYIAGQGDRLNWRGLPFKFFQKWHSLGEGYKDKNAKYMSLSEIEDATNDNYLHNRAGMEALFNPELKGPTGSDTRANKWRNFKFNMIDLFGGDKKDKAKETIARALPMLVRPTINLIKSLGNMAAESAKATQAMSVLSSALGNPFEEGTLEGITQWGSSFGDMSGSFVSGVGGMLGGVGEGVGRMANNAMMGDKADVNTNATQGGKGAGLGKAAGVFSAVTGIVGAYLGGVGQSISAGWGIANGLLRSINKATLKIMDTTPIFKTIKDILNLSFTMAFLPAMTLLQGKMLPIFVDLLNSAVKFGQEFAQEFLPYVPDLVESFQGVVKHVVDFFANNKEALAQMVAGMVALLPDMMELQLGLIKLFVDNRQKILDVADRTIEALQAFTDQGLLDAVLELAGLTVDFITTWGVPLAKAAIAIAKFFIGSFEGILEPIADALDHNNKAADAIQKGDFLSATVHSGMAINKMTPTNMIGSVATGFVKGIAGAFGIHFATGGYVPATPGGVPAIIGEGGEGEYVIPESKLNSIGGLTIVFSGNVYGMNDFKQQVRSIMNEYTTKASFR